jgi:hypothetical protein
LFLESLVTEFLFIQSNKSWIKLMVKRK